MAYDPNTTPPRRRTTGPGTWIAVAIAVLIIAALIWWFLAEFNDGDEVVEEPVVEEPVGDETLEEEPLEEEEDEGANRFRPDRVRAFTVDGVDVMIAA